MKQVPPIKKFVEILLFLTNLLVLFGFLAAFNSSNTDTSFAPLVLVVYIPFSLIVAWMSVVFLIKDTTGGKFFNYISIFNILFFIASLLAITLV